jgi:glycine cleavage system transcriptional repressor
MHTDIVLTLTGTDRVGIVEEVTGVLLGLEGNVETSRMVRLGGEFALLMLVSVPAERFGEFDTAVSALVAEGYRVTASPTHRAEPPHGGWLLYQVSVTGADHEGIIHEIASGLSQRGITIESMDTGTAEAPVSGTTLFSMTAMVLVPSHLAEDDWIAALAEAGDQANVDIEVSAAS